MRWAHGGEPSAVYPSSIRAGPRRAPGPCTTGGLLNVGLREDKRDTEISGVPVPLGSQLLSHPMSQGPQGMAPVERRVRKPAVLRGTPWGSQEERTALSLHTWAEAALLP